MNRIIIFLACVVTVHSLDLAYTKISFTDKGEPCLNNCKDNKCFTGYDLIAKTCTLGKETAPVYHTSMTQDKSKCLSRCGKYGYGYEWCFVSNEISDWDYCNSDVKINWTSGQQYTLDYGPCADECKMDGNKEYTCSNYNGYSYKCNPKRHPYIQARTRKGEKCVSDCWKYDTGDHHFWCRDAHLVQDYCAPPAKRPELNDFVQVPERNHCTRISGRKMQYKDFFDCNFNVSTTAEKLESLNYYQTVTVNEHRNPIYRYTMMPPNNINDPWLLLVVKARITTETISCCSVRKQESNATGLIIGHLIGGPKKVYNTVALRKSLDRTLRKYENEIHAWTLEERTNTVEITVIVMYKESNIPYAFGVDYNFLKNGMVWHGRTIRDVIVYNV